MFRKLLEEELKEVLSKIVDLKKTWEAAEARLEGDYARKIQLASMKAFLKEEFDNYNKAIKEGMVPDKGMGGGPLHYASITGDHESVKRLLTPDIEPEIEFCIGADGTVWGTGKYETLDWDWTIAVKVLIENILDGNYERKKFPEHSVNYKTIEMGDNATIAVIGDWGAGYWTKNSPPEAVAKVIRNMKPIPDYVIHLGDVYYAGTTKEEKECFSDIIPKGSKGTFALNSNHEMYSIAIPYFETISKSPFGSQDNSSYFALENDNWIITCLDTAFFASVEKFFLTGSLGKSNSQVTFLENMVAKAETADKKLIIMTHHNGFEGKGLKKTTEIWKEINDIISKYIRQNKLFWYWGHAHCGYSCSEVSNILGRCVGHGSIPWGKGSDFVIGAGSNLNWFENKTQTEEGSTLLMNGLMTIELQGSTIKETFFDQTGLPSVQIVNGKLKVPTIG